MTAILLDIEKRPKDTLSAYLYIVLGAGRIVLCGGHSYRALPIGPVGELKKKTALCRYCDKLTGVLTGLRGIDV